MTQKEEQLVVRFLRTMEARELEAAEALMAPGASIVYPGGKRFASQAEAAGAAGGRYRWVKKTIDQIESFAGPDEVIVYVRGRLQGVNLHGVEFSEVRYIDRFALKDGLIVSQEVWNDLAESGALRRTA